MDFYKEIKERKAWEEQEKKVRIGLLRAGYEAKRAKFNIFEVFEGEDVPKNFIRGIRLDMVRKGLLEQVDGEGNVRITKEGMDEYIEKYYL